MRRSLDFSRSPTAAAIKQLRGMQQEIESFSDDELPDLTAFIQRYDQKRLFRYIQQPP